MNCFYSTGEYWLDSTIVCSLSYSSDICNNWDYPQALRCLVHQCNMSVITLQVGQCGNQVGLQFFQTLMSDLQQSKDVSLKSKSNREYIEESLQCFFHRKDSSQEGDIFPSGMTARAVSVDMERKVIQNTVSQAKKSAIWQYPKGINL